jgi:HK97 family phage prohead protease
MINKFYISDAKVLDDRQGIVEAYVNTMGVKDADGDIIDPAAFDASIRANLPIPVLAGHDQSKLVGKVVFAQSEKAGTGDEHRLYTRMQMNMDTQAGQEAYSNIAGEYIREWSVGFNLPAGDSVAYGRAGKETVRRILDLDWVEVSAVIRGASPSTATIAAKSAPDSDLLEPATGESMPDDPVDAASDTVILTASDTASQQLRLARLRLALKVNQQMEL